MLRWRQQAGLKGGDDLAKGLKGGTLGHGDRASPPLFRIYRVIHYICNSFIVPGLFMHRHKESSLQEGDSLDLAALLLRNPILKGYLNLQIYGIHYSINLPIFSLNLLILLSHFWGSFTVTTWFSQITRLVENYKKIAEPTSFLFKSFQMCIFIFFSLCPNGVLIFQLSLNSTR